MDKGICTKPDDLSFISRTHMVEGETDFCNLSSDFHTNVMAQVSYGTVMMVC